MLIGVIVPSVEVIIGFVGSTIGTLICVIFPATCFVKIMQRNTSEKIVAQILIVIGFIIMILGTYSNLNALDSANSGSHLEVKIEKQPNEVVPVLHANDFPKIELPPSIAKDLPQVGVVKNQTIVVENKLQKVKEEKEKPKEEELVKISDEGIKKEEQEIAADKNEKPDLEESKDAQQEIKEKEKEIKELKASKDKLEQEVLEMKNVLIKQNQDTQQLVLQKFEEIAEKVDKIEKQSSLDVGPSKEKDDNHDEDEDGGGDHEKKISEVKDENKKEEVKKENEERKEVKKEKIEIPKAPVIKNSTKVESLKISQSNVTSNDHHIDPIVKLIKQQEPLSYKVGEKMSEGGKSKKDNLTAVVEEVKESEKDKAEKKEPKEGTGNDDLASHEDFKNEMRRKREIDFLDETLNKIDPLNVQLKSLISRDLKEAKENDDEM